MKRTVKILLILVIVAGAAYYFISRQGWTTIKRELKDFAIKDTAHITKFFFADRKGGKVLVEKSPAGMWMVDGKYKADIDKVNIVLATMHDIQVRNPLAENEFNTVVAFLASDGTKAEFYSGDKHLKTIYVGPATPDQVGTFMLIEGSSTPFVTHIPGFVGYLTPRFLTEAIKWRSKEIFDADPKDIRSVKVEYPGQPNESFMVQNGVEVTLSTVPGNKPVAADPKHLKFFIGSFHKLFSEGYEESYNGVKADSLRGTQPYCIISLEHANGETTRLQVHLKPVDRRTKAQADEKGNPLPYDTEKYFAFLDDQPEVHVIQDFTFGKVMKKMRDFAKVK